MTKCSTLWCPKIQFLKKSDLLKTTNCFKLINTPLILKSFNHNHKNTTLLKRKEKEKEKEKEKKKKKKKNLLFENSQKTKNLLLTKCLLGDHWTFKLNHSANICPRNIPKMIVDQIVNHWTLTKCSIYNPKTIV